MHGSLSQLMAEKAGCQSAVGYQVGGNQDLGGSGTACFGYGGARSEGYDEWPGSACEDSWRRSKSNVQHRAITAVNQGRRGSKRKRERFVRRDEKTEDGRRDKRGVNGGPVVWGAAVLARSGCRPWRANCREKQASSHSTPAGMKGGNQRTPSRPGPRTPTKQSKASLLYASKPSSKQANKQTTFQPFSDLRERVSGCSDAGRPAACQAARCREGPRTRWQRSGVRKLIPTGSPQLLLLDVFGSMSLHSPLPRMSTLGRDFEGWHRIGHRTTITRRG